MIIPDGEILFRFANPKAFPDGQNDIPEGIYQDRALSCDWEKYRPDPKSSYHIAEGKTVIVMIHVCEEIRHPRNPKRAGEIVEAWKQEIIHDPVSAAQDLRHGANDAHSLIRGLKKKAVTSAIRDHSAFHPSSDFTIAP